MSCSQANSFTSFVAPKRRSFVLPVRVLSAVYRDRFLHHLGKAFARVLDQARAIDWVVYAKRPFAGPEQVLRYLSRYTHRVAIANSRLVSMKDDRVTFQWKDYREDGIPKLMTLGTDEFIRRFLLHVLPEGFYRIRHSTVFWPMGIGRRNWRCAERCSRRHPR